MPAYMIVRLCCVRMDIAFVHIHIQAGLDYLSGEKGLLAEPKRQDE